MVAIPPRGSDHVARSSTRRRWRSKGIEGWGKGYHWRGEGETRSQWVYHRDGTPSKGWYKVHASRFYLSLHSRPIQGCKTYQNPVPLHFDTLTGSRPRHELFRFRSSKYTGPRVSLLGRGDHWQFRGNLPSKFDG